LSMCAFNGTFVPTQPHQEVIMSVHMFRRNVDAGRGRLSIASTIMLLAVVAMGYSAVAFVPATLPPPNDATTLAPPDRRAETYLGAPLAAPLATVPGFDGSRLSDAQWAESPRECDLGKGIVNACLFMD